MVNSVTISSVDVSGVAVIHIVNQLICLARGVLK